MRNTKIFLLVIKQQGPEETQARFSVRVVRGPCHDADAALWGSTSVDSKSEMSVERKG